MAAVIFIRQAGDTYIALNLQIFGGPLIDFKGLL